MELPKITIGVASYNQQDYLPDAIESILNQTKKPHEIIVKTTMKCLLYGQPGIGKTTFALSSPFAVLLDFDNGVHRVRSEHQTDTLQVNSWQEVVDAEKELAPYQTIVIDTAGKMLDYMAAHIMANNPKMKRGDGSLTLQGFGERKVMFSSFVKRISTMGKHLIFVAHEKEEKEGDGKYIRPEVGGSSGTDLYKELDIIGYMEAIGKKRTVSFAPTEKYYAKNACGLNDVIEFPELTDGATNTFFSEKIIDNYKQSLVERKEKVDAYAELMEVIEGKVASIESAEIAGDVLSWIDSYSEHIWSSKLQAKQLLNAKNKEVGITYDAKKKQFIEPAKQPVNA